MKRKILAIIPARSGSKGIPKKNIKYLLGKPLITWTIEQAKKSSLIDTVFVSTDSEEIANIAEKWAVHVPFLRPPELAKDDSPTIDAINHVIESFEKEGKTYDIIVLLEPTSPLRKAGDIDAAIRLFLDHYNHADALVSLGEVQLENPFIMEYIENNRLKKVISTNNQFYQRQQMPKVYFPYGVIYLSKIETLKKTRTFYQENTIPYLIERWQNYEIDDICDFLCVETILKQKLREVLG
jgi:CMP-N,N'-diacetyllegionaminic acid synthase